MSFRALVSRRALALSASLSLSLAACSTAFADTYHQVEQGETLSSIAARYATSPEALRSLNKLSFAEAAPLPVMLLRVPEAADSRTGQTNQSRSAAPSQAAVAAPQIPGQGSIARSVRYTVRAGDTVASIAAAFSRDGRLVSEAAIRDKNRLGGEVREGRELLIPISSAIYRSNAQADSGTGSSALNSTRVGAAEVSDEISWPVAEVVNSPEPMFRGSGQSGSASLNGARFARADGERSPSHGGSGGSRAGGSRGGSPRDYGRANPTSRGYTPGGRAAYGQQYGAQLDGARVLGSTEDAANTAPRVNGSQGRVVQAPVQAAPTAQKIARVARVSLQGAKIRRLPTDQAMALYACPTSTEVAVIRQSGAWSAILMSDKSTGWMPTRYVQFTGASVDISSIPTTESQYSNVRRTGRRGLALAGNFSSSNPFVASALGWLGTPYVYGGEGRRGIDCSSLVQHAFAANGVRLPRTAAEQARVGMNVPTDQLQPGDRLYFSASGTRIDHTGLYMGDGLFVQASGSGHAVIVSNFSDSWNYNIFVCARR